MYGQIHCVIRELVQEKFGEAAWLTVLEKSGLDKHEHFLVFTRYEDPVTLKLVGAASETLGVPVEGVLQVFGGFFLTYCLRHGYDKMLKTLGGDIISFIQNLDSLHSLLSLSYKGIDAPSFRCEEDVNGQLMLHYYSPRAGLYPIVIGMVEAVGKELFNQEVKLTVVSRNEEETEAKTQYHTVFRVQQTMSNDHQTKSLVGALSPIPGSVLRSPDDPVSSTASKDSLLKADDFCGAFPYHILLDENLCICQCGDNIRRITSVCITDGLPFNHIGDIIQPVMKQTMDNIFKFINAVFLLAIYREPGDKRQPFVLKGQMIWLTHSSKMLFIGSPRLRSLNELMEMKVYLADIPIYDCTRELVLLNQQRIAEIDIAKKLDETTTALQKTSKALEEEKQKTEDLLHEMLPKKVAMQLTQGIAVTAEKFDCVTILFSDIVTFTNIAAASTPMDIVNMLNDLYQLFDSHTVIHNVYKVETIGDAYMGVAGVPEVQEDHAECIADFALDMLEDASTVLSPATGLPLQIRIGLHSGPVVAGVVGKKMPRYCLFGDTVNTASRMESHSLPGRIHLSEVTYKALFDHGYVFKRRGQTEVKGKGLMNTYFLMGNADRRVLEPEDDYTQLPEVQSDSPIYRVRKRSGSSSRSFNFFKKSSSSSLFPNGRSSQNSGSCAGSSTIGSKAQTPASNNTAKPEKEGEGTGSSESCYMNDSLTNQNSQNDTTCGGSLGKTVDTKERRRRHKTDSRLCVIV